MKNWKVFLAAGILAMSLGCSSVLAGPTDPIKIEKDDKSETWTLVDDENCMMKITEIVPDGEWGYTMKVDLENKTDKELMFSVLEASVNGVMSDPFWAFSVLPGQKAMQEITWLKTEEQDFMKEVTTVTLGVWIYDNNSEDSDSLLEEYFTVDPLGTDKVKLYERQAGSEDLVLADTEDFRITVLGFDPDDVWGYAMKVYLENKTDKKLTCTVFDAAVNETVCDPFWSVSLLPGTSEFSKICWDMEDLKENGIEEVEILEIPFAIYDDATWEEIQKESYTITPW